MYFDTHAHYDSGAFSKDRYALLEQVHAEGVDLIVDPGCDRKSSEQAIALAERFSFVYAAVGYHPGDLDDYNEEGYRRICQLAAHPKCVAIGEIGLDYYWDDSRKPEQKALFHRQLQLALEMGKPVIVHDREAHGDCMEIVREYPELRGVFHCFSGSVEMAEELLRKGWYLGFDGPVTYKNARKALEVLEICPLDKILVETDSPYLSPIPLRGKRNDSRNLRYIVEKIAQVKGVEPREMARITQENGRTLFGI